MQLKDYMRRIMSSVGSSSSTSSVKERRQHSSESTYSIVENVVEMTRRKISAATRQKLRLMPAAIDEMGEEKMKENNNEEEKQHNLIMAKTRNKRHKKKYQSFCESSSNNTKSQRKRNYGYNRKGSRWQLLDNEPGMRELLEKVDEVVEEEEDADCDSLVSVSFNEGGKEHVQKKQQQQEVLLQLEDDCTTKEEYKYNEAAAIIIDSDSTSSAYPSHTDKSTKDAQVHVPMPLPSSSSFPDGLYGSLALAASETSSLESEDFNLNSDHENEQQRLKQVVLNGINTFVNNNETLESLLTCVEQVEQRQNQFVVKPSASNDNKYYYLLHRFRLKYRNDDDGEDEDNKDDGHGFRWEAKRKLQMLDKAIRNGSHKISFDTLQKTRMKRGNFYDEVHDSEEAEERVDADKKQSKLIKARENRNAVEVGKQKETKMRKRDFILGRNFFSQFMSKSKDKKKYAYEYVKKMKGTATDHSESKSSMEHDKTNQNGMAATSTSTSNAINSNKEPGEEQIASLNSMTLARSQIKARRKVILKGLQKSGRRVGKALKVGFMSMGNSMIPQHYILPTPYETSGSCRSTTWLQDHRYYLGYKGPNGRNSYDDWKDYEYYDEYEFDREKYLEFYARLRERERNV